ncbi:hypothetical protein FH5_03790 [Priestia endophytica]|nr:hypothetical protein FH5_03790 [Priestia endophytica]
MIISTIFFIKRKTDNEHMFDFYFFFIYKGEKYEKRRNLVT